MKPIKVFIVDDTAIYRKILSDVVSHIDGLELIGTAPRGSIALDKLRNTPCDLVLLDIFMPEMDGLETLSRIKKEFPKTNVIMVSGATTRDTEITIKALRNGAMDFIAKPQAPSFEEGMRIITAEVIRIMNSFGIYSTHSRVTTDKSTTALFPTASSTTTLPSANKIKTRIPGAKSVPPNYFELVLIGVSTGGPKTLSGIIPKLPANLNAPVLIVQHMPPVFTASLAEHLNRDSELEVREAKDMEVVKRGDVLIAPGGRHMTVAKTMAGYVVKLTDDAPVNSCRPAVDVLFNSVALCTNNPVLAVVLTGMGEDGARGVATLKLKTCYCLSQSKESCVVYGMPQAVESRDLADEVLPADKIAERITQLVNRAK